MHRISLFAVAVTGIYFLIGCSKAPSNDTATTTKAAAQSPATEAVTRAASNFLDAVIKGDTQRASACLTPQAMQRIIASGKPFNPPGFEMMTFKVGEVRMPAVDRAFVGFAVINVASGQPTSDEVACVMRLVENEWRVSGLAAWGPNQSVTELNFEADQAKPSPRRPVPLDTVGKPIDAPPGTPTLPPRVATEAGTTSPY
jgi:hypothetical protein